MTRTTKKRGPNNRKPVHLKDKLDTRDVAERYGLSTAQIRNLAAGDEPTIRGDKSPSGRWATSWDEIFRVEGWLQDGRRLTSTERSQAMEKPLTPKQFAKHPSKDGPECEEDSVRKAIREGRQVGVFRIGHRYYLRAAWVVKLSPRALDPGRRVISAEGTRFRLRAQKGPF